MSYWNGKILAPIFLILLMGPTLVPLLPGIMINPSTTLETSATYQFTPSASSSQVPLRRLTLVAPDSNSYIDDFAYMSAIPASVFNHADTQYISPLIYTSGSESEEWLLEDWVEYTDIDGGLTQVMAIGDYSESMLTNLQYDIGAKIYPRITGTSSADIAATIAVSEWRTSDTAIIALSKDSFDTNTPVTGSATHTFENQESQLSEFSGSVIDNLAPSSITFTPPTWAGWIEGRFNWTGTEILTHELIDPSGTIVDYSVYNQVYFSRYVGYVENPVPLNFWVPVTSDGEWTMNITRNSIGTTNMECEVVYHPGFTHTVAVPSEAEWLNITLTWDNVATDVDLALIDPTGRLAMWAPAGSILANPGQETIDLPYPMEGDWNIVTAWADATVEQNNIEITWEISELPSDLQAYLESAANAAVLASLMNAPLLYVDVNQVPTKTEWALSRLGVSTVILVDPLNIHASSLVSDLSALYSVTTLDTYTSLSSNIITLSENPDIVITIPTGDNNEFFGPAAYSAAVHGSPIFSLCGTDNHLTTRAQETWAPYLIGPEINNVYVVNKYDNRAENGWYDERIPNKYSMMKSVDDFEGFLTLRGAFNSTSPQPVVVVAPVSLLPISFDRSLQCDFQPGRIPAESPAEASVLINRGLLHRYLFLTAENADTSLVSMYAYTDGSQVADNNLDTYLLYQLENTTDALESAGFEIEQEVGVTEVFSQLDSQVALWTISTHGTLTLLPRDPPDRPNGQGYFSLRNSQSPYGFEDSLAVRESPSDANSLVNPVAFTNEAANHVTKSTDELEAAIDNIGSPIVILTACLLGGTGMPLMLMQHGAVAVTASPRTVYFQPAGMLSVLLAQALSEGSTIGAALSNGLTLTSSDYSNPLTNRDPRDYANQQILFGDPSVRLYEPVGSPHVATIDSESEVFNTHTPGRGVPTTAALGASSYLQDALSTLIVDFDYYESSNFSDFVDLLSLRNSVIIEPDTLPLFSDDLLLYTDEINDFVRAGGILALMGVSVSADWCPWPISYVDSGAGSSIVIVDTNHPLLNAPNDLSTGIDYQGHFESLWTNFAVLATDGTDPVIIVSSIGSGKLVLTTTNPAGVDRDEFVENVIEWDASPSILVKDISLSQSIIWANDVVTITVELTDLVGNAVDSANLRLWLNVTEADVVEVGSGLYTVFLAEDFTSTHQGTFDVRLEANKAGYDTLSIVIEDYLLIRPFPWLAIGLFGGGVVVAAGGWFFLKRRRGESITYKRDKSSRSKSKRKTKEEKQKDKEQKERDSKFDTKEFFGV
ncbi:MAG: C25 family cysteine peptidase [Candidatus Thorarchaeota archaeon]